MLPLSKGHFHEAEVTESDARTAQDDTDGQWAFADSAATNVLQSSNWLPNNLAAMNDGEWAFANTLENNSVYAGNGGTTASMRTLQEDGEWAFSFLLP